MTDLQMWMNLGGFIALIIVMAMIFLVMWSSFGDPTEHQKYDKEWEKKRTHDKDDNEHG